MFKLFQYLPTNQITTLTAMDALFQHYGSAIKVSSISFESTQKKQPFDTIITNKEEGERKVLENINLLQITVFVCFLLIVFLN